MNYSITEQNGNVLIEGVKDFNPDQIFDCGQCFRFEKNDSGIFTGIAFNRIAGFSYDNGVVTVHNSSPEDYTNIWHRYLDLDTDYGAIKSTLCEKDETIRKAILYGSGIRILNQEPWETLVSFIISQNSNIPRIKSCIEKLASLFGKSVGTMGGREYFSLPEPDVLAGLTADDLAPCRLGYRADYLIRTAQAVSRDNGETLALAATDDFSYAEAVNYLMSLPGVGPKVANCIALFALGKRESFPIDVWVKRVMSQLYGFNEKDVSGISRFAYETFGENSGIAQQYLFYYMRCCEGI